jgi:hypothetical protein
MLVEHEHISGVLNYCFKNVKATEKYFLQEFYKKQKEGLVSTVPYLVPIGCLSCLNKNGSDVSIKIKNGLVEFRYGEDKKRKSFHHLEGFFRGNLDGKEVTGAMVGGCTGHASINPPNISIKREITEIEKILQKMDEGMVEDADYIKELLLSD